MKLRHGVLAPGLLSFCLATFGAPRPMVLENSATIVSPDTAYSQFGAAVGIDGDSPS
jgi:hypothetical protein